MYLLYSHKFNSNNDLEYDSNFYTEWSDQITKKKICRISFAMINLVYRENICNINCKIKQTKTNCGHRCEAIVKKMIERNSDSFRLQKLLLLKFYLIFKLLFNKFFVCFCLEIFVNFIFFGIDFDCIMNTTFS